MFVKGSDTETEFSPNDLVREAAALLDRDLASKKISLDFAMDETLPLILADQVRMQRVMVNLFTNAIESLGRHEAGLDALRSAQRRSTVGTS